MLRVSFILADALHQFHIREEFKRDGYFPGSRIRFRIVDRDLHIQVTEVAPVKAFDGVESVTVRVAAVIKPRLIVEAFGFDDERIAFPSANGISHPSWLHLFGEVTPIGECLSVPSLVFKKNQHHSWRLDELEW